jgi:tRNA1Val (adenine37-N6)-methyltransferase
MNRSRPLKDETLDTFYQGRVLVLQKRRGYRFSVDAPLLADFIETRPGDALLELGTGCGIIALLLALKPFRRLVALEIQPSLVEERLEVLETDFRFFTTDERFDVVFSNPPYIRRRGGHLSLSAERSIARHEVACDIFDVMAKTAELLARDGRAHFIYPVRRTTDFRTALDRSGLGLRRFRPVLPREGAPANLFLAACGFEAGPAEELAPLVLFGPDGTYSAEAQEIFSGRAHA